MNSLKTGASVLGWLILLAATVHFVCGYGTRWEFGRLGKPSANRATIQADRVGPTREPFGVDEEFYLLELMLLAVMLGYVVHLKWELHRKDDAVAKAFQARQPRLSREDGDRLIRDGRPVS